MQHGTTMNTYRLASQEGLPHGLIFELIKVRVETFTKHAQRVATSFQITKAKEYEWVNTVFTRHSTGPIAVNFINKLSADPFI
jgi:hypothetical protein